MQKPRFRTADKAAWVFVNTHLHPTTPKTIDRRTAMRCGYLTTAAHLLGVSEKKLPLPLRGERMSKYIARVKANESNASAR